MMAEGKTPYTIKYNELLCYFGDRTLMQSSTVSELLPMVAADQLEGMSVFFNVSNCSR